MLQGGLFEAFLRRWRKLSKQANHGYRRRSTPSGCCSQEEEGVPEDVPRGHTVVYVGERRRRFVVLVASLEHPLFRALLDQAREEFGFGDGGKLRMPCDEALFLSVLCHVSSRRRRGVWLCL
ncbi:protein SMALL AUXIN UP-REGULATED RNA 12-like [Musa acuminata AAA Group]|uniref:protein SMALL AUXIN UP-REGULATED RNA 12-like n=1 Tax=Musa acuminata AAA Group TaxID=214697 RepID=UPI0031DD08EF